VTGVLLLDKPPGPSSHDAVAAVRRALGTRRVGHFGTLDPFASGLLVCGVGHATRLAPFAAGHEKTYRVAVRLGWRSTTDDIQGALTSAPVAEPPSRAAVERAVTAWVGEVSQVPPAYSAKHVEGKRAYARARAGERVDLPETPVLIRGIEIERYAYPDLELTVECGAGTYMRALARDLGEDLRTGGYCTALRRVRSGPFGVEEALSWEALTEGGGAEVALRPAEALIAHLPVAEIDAAGQEAVFRGQALPLPDTMSAAAGWVRLCGPAGFIGLAEVREGRSGMLLQPRKILFAPGQAAREPLGTASASDGGR
jgi:tRNA pseudouridine55 synthase